MKMKRLFVILSLALCVILAGCSQAPVKYKSTEPDLPVYDDTDTSEPVQTEAQQQSSDEYLVFSSAEQDFSFLYDSSFTSEWNDEAGAIIYTKSGDTFPRLQIHRTIYGDTTGFAVEEYFYFEIEEMKQQFNATAGEFQTYTISGVKIPGVMYEYTQNGKDVALFSLMNDTGESLIKYSCFYYQNDSDSTMQALAEAVGTYQPDAAYYTGGSAAPQQTPAPQTTAAPAPTQPTQPAVTLNLVKYDGGFFSVMLPEGWRIQTMGQYTTFGFRAWDPQNQDYQIFYYGQLNPFMKSDAAKQWYIDQYIFGYPYTLCADTIVVDQYDVSSLFYQWNEFADNVAKYTGTAYAAGFSFPSLTNFGEIDTLPITTYFSSVASAEAIVTGSFQSEQGASCYAKLCASLVPGTPTYQGGADVSFLQAYSVSGVLAPKDGFLDVEQTLSQAIYSLSFTQAYVDEANAYTIREGEAAMAANAALQETYARYNEAWRSYILEYDLLYIQDGDIYQY